jgi:tetratricopeptide (TPR) repeat protein
MKKNVFAILMLLVVTATGGSAQTARPVSAQNAQAVHAQAMKDYEAGKFEPAAAGFSQVVKMSPQKYEGHFYLGSANYELKKTDEAIVSLKEAIRLKPNSSEAHFALGRIYYEREEYETSLPLVETSHKLNRKWTAPMILLGDNYRMLGRLKSAIVPYQSAIGFDEKNPQARLGLGLTYVELNNKIAARQQLVKLQTLDKTLAEQLKTAIDK